MQTEFAIQHGLTRCLFITWSVFASLKSCVLPVCCNSYLCHTICDLYTFCFCGITYKLSHRTLLYAGMASHCTTTDASGFAMYKWNVDNSYVRYVRQARQASQSYDSQSFKVKKLCSDVAHVALSSICCVSPWLWNIMNV